MKKALLPLLLTAALLVSLLSWTVWSAQSSLRVAINDTVIENPGGLGPATESGVIYVPIDVFTQYLGVRYGYDSITSTLTLYKGARALYFNLSTNTVADQNNDTFNQKAYIIQGQFYVPVDFCARYLGFRYSYIYVDTGSLLRISDSSASLSDKQLADQYSSRRPSVNPTPDPGVITPEPEPEDPEEPEVVRNIYLTFSDCPNAATSTILDVLASGGVQATFFLTPEGIREYPELVVRMAAEGHSLGIDLQLPANQLMEEADCMAYLAETQTLLRQIIKTDTLLVRLNRSQGGDLSESARQAMQNQGWHLWSAHVTDAALPSGSTSAYRELKTRLEGRTAASVVQLSSTNRNAEALRLLLRNIDRKNYLFHLIRYTTPPL
ncbi:MAG: polysaccharide deacetylase family protein [Eubacteriales bacterium]|jgi:peptidoglycan/xylan/chitin deacetylase (PgdA/CDA1 family)